MFITDLLGSLVAIVVFNPVEYTVAEDAGSINFVTELLTSTERQLSITLNVSDGSAQGIEYNSIQFSYNTERGRMHIKHTLHNFFYSGPIWRLPFIQYDWSYNLSWY